MEETTRLDRLGDALEAAAVRDLRAARRPRRRLLVAAVAAAALVPAAAFGAAHLISNDDVAKSLPAGTLSLAGTEPRCTTVDEGVEYHCLLARPPAPEVSDWKGTVEPTVDATKHVNGGCRSLTSAGTEWECYIGAAAVDQQIVSAGFLGQFAPAPGVG
ncbi:MAG TPA: hypothetical protein VFK17_04930 [Gaiellaceae bacterium]|jgi:hypothetical protein|nr:hypothetical protein [Gaiellaceae bacterium]